MANYKTADQLPILEEVTETTYALVEDGGALKRVSGELLGGKSNCCVITMEFHEAAKPSELDPTAPTITCNMTYNELMEALQNRTVNGFNVIAYMGTQMGLNPVNEVYFGSDAPGIMIIMSNNMGTLCFASDDTISMEQPS